MQYSIGTEVSNWLHQRLWKDHHLRLAERIPLHSRGQIYGGQSVALGRCAECRWSGSGTLDLISEDFHSAKQRLNPGNNSLREIPIKETVALPSEQFYLTTELSNVVGISFIFVTSFGRYPCRQWYAFSSGKLTVHRHGTLFLCTKIPFWYRVTAALEYRLSVDSQTIQRSVSALSAACFCSQQTRFRLLYIAFDPLLGSPSEGLFCDRFLSVTLFLFWRSASSLWSKHRVIICSML